MEEWIKKESKPELDTAVETPPEPAIISDSFFLLTSSSFSSDFSKGLMPTDWG